jgi:hypothetical protein
MLVNEEMLGPIEARIINQAVKDFAKGHMTSFFAEPCVRYVLNEMMKPVAEQFDFTNLLRSRTMKQTEQLKEKYEM